VFYFHTERHTNNDGHVSFNKRSNTPLTTNNRLIKLYKTTGYIKS